MPKDVVCVKVRDDVFACRVLECNLPPYPSTTLPENQTDPSFCGVIFKDLNRPVCTAAIYNHDFILVIDLRDDAFNTDRKS